MAWDGLRCIGWATSWRCASSSDISVVCGGNAWRALAGGRPESFNTYHGARFTSDAFTATVFQTESKNGAPASVGGRPGISLSGDRSGHPPNHLATR